MSNPYASYNFFRLDDWFLRIALFWFIGALLFSASMRSIHGFDLLLLLAIFVPPALIGFIGLRVRKAEKRTISVWRILDGHTSIKANELIENSDITREQLRDAVKLLNNRGLGFYVWNKKTDTIHDSRLDDDYVMVDSCESCAAPVGLRISLADSEVPSCSYCESPVASGQLNLLKQATIAELRGFRPVERQYGTPVRKGKSPFSVFWFVGLLMLCWPLAVVYAIYATRSRRT